MMVMPSFQVVLLLLWFLCVAKFSLSLSRSNSQISGNIRDREVLLQFKKGVVDPSSLLSSWSKEEDCCKWIGVQCDNMTGRVSMLDLNYFSITQNLYLERLTGEINLCVLQLDFLNYLDLSFNNFTTIRDTANDRLRYHNLSLHMPQHQNANISTLFYLDLSWNSYLQIDHFRWLSHIPSLKYLNLTVIDLHRENDCLHSISALLPSLLELRLAGCQCGSVSPFLKYVNFTSLTLLDLSENSLSFLDLRGNEVDGISDTLLNLQNLKHLDLSMNKLNGTIPKWLGQLKNLQVLDLSYNSFHGSIPLELGNLSTLTDLDMKNNHLSGSLPETLHKLSSLSRLDIAENSLGGVISESKFTNLTSLKELDLSSSTFHFNVSSNWIPPFQLEEIHLGSCILGPKFPTWLYTQRSLESLSVPSTGISFVDHDKFWSFVSSHVTFLDISNNSISGDISNRMLSTGIIYLTSNKFNGGLPRITPSVFMFFAGNNSFSGSIAPFLCGIDNSNQHYLDELDLSNNHLSGEVADCWMKWKSLTSINLAGNNLTGRIPSSMGSLSSLKVLDLYDNNFSGDIPMPLQQCNQLKFLILGENQFSGSIPSWIPLSITALVLRGNKFSGNIPSNICQLSSLILLDLAENNLSGSIPECLYNLTSMKDRSEFLFANLTIIGPYSTFPYPVWFHTKGQEFEYKFKFTTFWRLIDLSKNNLVGPIPHELFHLIGLVSLNLSQNHLTGNIPPDISEMKNLESLDLSINHLSGEIPQVMSSLSFLEYLNLSFNNFIGRIPIGTQLQSFNESSYMGNLELCGVPLKNCTEEKKSFHIVNAKAEDEFLSWFYIGMGVGFATGFWGVCVALFFKRSCRHAYFRFLDNIKDQLYVKVLLIMNSIR